MLELGHELTVEAAKSFPSQESASLLRQHVVHPEDTYISMNLVYLHIIVISLIKRYILTELQNVMDMTDISV